MHISVKLILSTFLMFSFSSSYLHAKELAAIREALLSGKPQLEEQAIKDLQSHPSGHELFSDLKKVMIGRCGLEDQNMKVVIAGAKLMSEDKWVKRVGKHKTLDTLSEVMGRSASDPTSVEELQRSLAVSFLRLGGDIKKAASSKDATVALGAVRIAALLPRDRINDFTGAVLQYIDKHSGEMGDIPMLISTFADEHPDIIERLEVLTPKLLEIANATFPNTDYHLVDSLAKISPDNKDTRAFLERALEADKMGLVTQAIGRFEDMIEADKVPAMQLLRIETKLRSILKDPKYLPKQGAKSVSTENPLVSAARLASIIDPDDTESLKAIQFVYREFNRRGIPADRGTQELATYMRLMQDKEPAQMDDNVAGRERAERSIRTFNNPIAPEVMLIDEAKFFVRALHKVDEEDRKGLLEEAMKAAKQDAVQEEIVRLLLDSNDSGVKMLVFDVEPCRSIFNTKWKKS